MAASHLLPLLFFLTFLLFLLPPAYSGDINCLQGIKHSLKDPHRRLRNWNFSSTTKLGFICDFTGVGCWNTHESRLLKLQLHHFQLSGEIPESLRLCSSGLQYMDLSGNNFSGNIPSSLCKWFPYLVYLDLSQNQLTGEIPAGLGNCRYLNKLNLSDNRLSGNIPPELNSLKRLSSFSVADNGLKGSIPGGLDRFGSSAFAGNGELCGKPVGKCGRLS